MNATVASGIAAPARREAAGGAVATRILLLLYAAFILSYVDRAVFALSLKPVKAALGLSDTQLGLLTGLAFAAAYAAFSPIAGWLADRFARKLVLVAAVLVWSVATIATAFARDFPAMFAARAFVGTGEAAVMPLALALLSDARADRQLRDRSFAIFFTSPIAGQAAALLFGGALVQSLPSIGGLQPWQSLFILAGGVGLLLVPAILFLMREPARPVAAKGERHVGAWRFLFGHARLAAALYLGMSLLQTAYVAGLTWDVIILQRAHGWTAGNSGIALALTACPLAMIGSLMSVHAVSRLRRASVPAAPLLIGAGASVIYVLLTAAGLLAADGRVSLGLLAIGFFFGPPTTVCGFIAMSETLPPPVRARLGGVNTVANAAICNTAGAYLIGVFSDRLFPSPAGITAAVALTGALATALGVVVIWSTLPAYVSRLREAGAPGAS